MSETLLHFSRKPLEAPYSVRQIEGSADYKPLGLWFSVGDGVDSWPDFCRNANCFADDLMHAVEIVPHDDARLLWLRSPDEMWTFNARFGERKYKGFHSNYVRWDRVADPHQGIVIAPYQWGMRMSDDLSWYYTWDCASGCIWDADAIAEVRAFAE